MEPLNNIDAVILISVLISMLIAFIRGFAKEMLSIVGLALFVILTVYTTPLLLPIVNEYIASKMLAQFLIFLLIMAIFYTIWIISTDKLIAKVRTSTLSFMDRLFGLIFGFLRAVIIICKR
jgi:membrane protein required for colicin V production